MDWRERIFDDFAGEVEYHPKRGLIYLALGTTALLVGLYYPQNSYQTIPLIFGLGSVPLLIKTVFFFRRSSEGLGLSARELEQVSSAAKQKKLPPAITLIAQVIQDFGTGPCLIGFSLYEVVSRLTHPDPDYTALLLYGRDTEPAMWTSPLVQAAAVGVILIGVAWLARRRYTFHNL